MPLLDTTANGVYIIAATPFTDDGAVDTASLDRLMDFYVGCGITGVTVLGIMGEAPKLTHAEVGRADAAGGAARERAAGDRRRVRAGLRLDGGAGERRDGCRRGRRDDRAAGARSRPTTRSSTYFANAVEAIGADVPFVLQDYPYASGVYMAPSVIRRIVTDNPSCKMVKHEEWPGLEKLTALKNLMAERHAQGRDPVRQWRHLPAARAGARRGRRQHRLRVSRNAGAAGQADQGGRARRRARPVRPASAAVALRAAARNARAWRCANTSSSAAARSPAMRSASRASSCRRKRSPRSNF